MINSGETGEDNAMTEVEIQSDQKRHGKFGVSDVEFYNREGYYLPIRAVSTQKARQLVDWLDRLPSQRLKELDMPWQIKSHLLFPVLDDLVRNPAVLDAVTAIYGPDILAIGADLFIKPARNEKRFTWHQDLNYWHLDPMEVVTAWIALTKAIPENGCMRYSPGGHHLKHVPHTESYAADNMLSRGQVINVEIDESKTVDVVLQPGEAALHHGFMPHASGPNCTDEPRIAFSVRYAPTRVRQLEGPPMTAMLAAGVDRYGNFALEPRPFVELDEAAVLAHREALAPHKAERFSTI